MPAVSLRHVRDTLFCSLEMMSKTEDSHASVGDTVVTINSTSAVAPKESRHGQIPPSPAAHKGNHNQTYPDRARFRSGRASEADCSRVTTTPRSQRSSSRTLCHTECPTLLNVNTSAAVWHGTDRVTGDTATCDHTRELGLAICLMLRQSRMACV